MFRAQKEALLVMGRTLSEALEESGGEVLPGQGHKQVRLKDSPECLAVLSELCTLSFLNGEKTMFGGKLEAWDTVKRQ